MYSIKLYVGITVSQIPQQTLFCANIELVFLHYFDFFFSFFSSFLVLRQLYFNLQYLKNNQEFRKTIFKSLKCSLY